MEKLNLFQRIIKVMEEVKSVHKDVSVSTGYNGPSYQAVSHDDVTSLLHGPCTKYGIVIMPSIVEKSLTSFTNNKGNVAYQVELTVDVHFINSDNREDSITLRSFAYAFDSSDKAVGKAFSMAVKYTYLKTFMLESLDHEEARDQEREFGSFRSPTQPPDKSFTTGKSVGSTSINSPSAASEGKASFPSGQQLAKIKELATQKNAKAKFVKTKEDAEAEIKRLSSL